ncbi:MAG: hypothetical protein HQK97_03295 [Nitrospirae bacterium]|nr:hypothetical protein [Nitrospirota bacterium]
MKTSLLTISAIIVASLTMSCQERYTVPKTNELPMCNSFSSGDGHYDNMTDVDLKAAYIVEQLEQYGDIPRFSNKIIVTSFVDLSNLNKTSMFGRLIAEEVMSKLHIKGYRVTDVREMKTIVMSNKVGELYLSRGPQPELGTKIDVTPKNFNFDYTNTLIVAGTYQVEPCDVFINVRLISPELGEVISVASVKIPRSSMVVHLLSKSNELPEEPMPSIRLRQMESVPVVKPPAPIKSPKKKGKKPKSKKVVKKSKQPVISPANHDTHSESSTATKTTKAPELSGSEPAVRVEVTAEPPLSGQTSALSPGTAKSSESSKSVESEKSGEAGQSSESSKSAESSSANPREPAAKAKANITGQPAKPKEPVVPSAVKPNEPKAPSAAAPAEPKFR